MNNAMVGHCVLNKKYIAIMHNFCLKSYYGTQIKSCEKLKINGKNKKANNSIHATRC